MASRPWGPPLLWLFKVLHPLHCTSCLHSSSHQHSPVSQWILGLIARWTNYLAAQTFLSPREPLKGNSTDTSLVSLLFERWTSFTSGQWASITHRDECCQSKWYRSIGMNFWLYMWLPWTIYLFRHYLFLVNKFFHPQKRLTLWSTTEYTQCWWRHCKCWSFCSRKTSSLLVSPMVGRQRRLR